MDKNVARKLFNPLFYLPLQLFEKMNKKLVHLNTLIANRKIATQIMQRGKI